MERSGFFNAIIDQNGTPDRSYSAENFARYFGTFIGNGVFPNPSTQCQVIANDDMTVTIKQGKAWINGYYYENTDDHIVALDVADGLLNRIDRVVLKLDFLNREIKSYVKKGQFASKPVAPNLQRDADAYELGIADIYIAAGATSIVQANITDQRQNQDLCGIVNSLITADTKTLFNQFTDGFNTWFAGIKNTLGSDAAGNLLNLINGLAGDGRTTETVKGNADNIKALDQSVNTHLADITNKLNNLNTNDVEARREILDLKLKLDEQQVLAFLNKTGIGFYDLFKNIDSIDTTNTTATIADTDVTFEGNKLLKFKQQQFSTFNNVELAVYDKDRQYINIDTDISNSNTIQVTVPPDSIIAGDKFYVNGQIYTVTSVQLA